MKAFHKRLAVLLCVIVSIGIGSATASEDNGVSDWDAKYARLLVFATEIKAWEEEGFWDVSALDSYFLYLRAEAYEQGKLDALDDAYSGIESLSLSGFNQAQFEEILPQVPNLRRLELWGCNVEDLSPLLPLAPRLTLQLDWQPDLLEQLAVLPNLFGLEISDIPDADLSQLVALTGLEALALGFDSDSTVDLSPLGMLPRLRSLELNSWRTPSDTLPDMPALEALKLYCGIDAAQLEHTPALQKLYLDYYIPDDLTPLYTLRDLTYLEINAGHADITAYVEQLEALHEAMPALQIILYYCC